MKKAALFLTLFILIIAICSCEKNADPKETSDTVTDIDGNVYQKIIIGDQVWMEPNLRVTHYADNTPIPEITFESQWTDLISNNSDRAYCWYLNDEETYASHYGALYTWAAAMDGHNSSSTNPSHVQGACPDGWHIPSDAEWLELLDYLEDNGYGYEGAGDDIAKSLSAKTGWTPSNIDGAPGNNMSENNSTGFNAYPGGYRSSGGATLGFYAMGNSGTWWSSTDDESYKAWVFILINDHLKESRFTYSKSTGLSVRCIKD